MLKGYPKRLKGEDIPLHSKIITVVDAFYGMIEDREYKSRLSQKEALTELIRCKGAQFDPQVVNAIVTAMKKTVKIESVLKYMNSVL